MRYGRYRAGLLVLGIALLFSIQSEAAAKKTIYNSPYVSFSPDGRAFTTCAGDRNYVWYARDDSTTVYTQIPSSLRDPVVGEHIYTEKRYGEIPVGYWKVVHRPGQCIHNGINRKKLARGIFWQTKMHAVLLFRLESLLCGLWRSH